jgi:uncharacterized membrane protein
MSVATPHTTATSPAPAARTAAARRDAVLRGTLAALGVLGVAIAGYLTYVHYAGIDPVCTGGGGCEKVQTSQWSTLAGVPVALLGLLGYLAVLGTLAVPGERGRLATATVAWLGLAVSAYLQYRALATVHATCVWCLGSAVTMAVTTGVSTARYGLADPT